MDRFAIESVAGAGVTVVMAKGLPQRVGQIGPDELGRISAELARNAPAGLLEELQQQNQELLNALEELRKANRKSRSCTAASSKRPTAACWLCTPSSTRGRRRSNGFPI